MNESDFFSVELLNSLPVKFRKLDFIKLSEVDSVDIIKKTFSEKYQGEIQCIPSHRKISRIQIL